MNILMLYRTTLLLLFITSSIQLSSQIRIDSLNNVGVGTTNPKAKLDVNGNLSISNKSGIANKLTGFQSDTIVSVLVGNNLFLENGVLNSLNSIDNDTTNELSSYYENNIEPNNPKQGDLWYNTNHGQLNVFYKGLWELIDEDLSPFNEGEIIFEGVSPNVVGFRSSTNYQKLLTLKGSGAVTLNNNITNQFEFSLDTNILVQITRDSISIEDADADPTNELDTFYINNTWISNGDSLSIESGSAEWDSLLNVPAGFADAVDDVDDGDTTYWSPISTNYLRSKPQRIGINVNPATALHINPEPGAALGDMYAILGDGQNGLVLRTPTASNTFAGQFYGVMKWWNSNYLSIFEDESGSQGTTGQVWGRKATGRMGWVDDQVNPAQTLIFSSPNLTLSNGGGTIDLSSLQDGTGPWNVNSSGINYTAGTVSIGTTISNEELRVLGRANISDGNNNTFIASGTGNTTLTGSTNLGLGPNTLKSLTTGSSNIGIGSQSMFNSTTPTNAISIGNVAMFNGLGNDNIAIGTAALYNINGTSNIGIGRQSLYSNNGANNNTVIGHQAYFNNTSGGNNTILGWRGGYNNINGSGNVLIGYGSGYNETGSNKLYIDNSTTTLPLIYGDFATNVVRINGEFEIADLSGGTAINSLGVDNTGQVVQIPLPSSGITALNINDTGNSIIEVDDQNGANQFRITADNVHIKVQEGNTDDLDILRQAHHVELFDLAANYTTTGNIDFSNNNTTSGSFLAGSAANDEVTTSATFDDGVKIMYSGTASINSFCVSNNITLQIMVDGNSRRSIGIDLEPSKFTPFFIQYKESQLLTTEEIAARVSVPASSGGTCIVTISNVVLSVESI